jgi:hypothetical protein
VAADNLKKKSRKENQHGGIQVYHPKQNKTKQVLREDEPF